MIRLLLYVLLLFLSGWLTACSPKQGEPSGQSLGKEIEPENVTLVYATLYLDVEMKRWIEQYNQSQDKICVVVKEYASMDLEDDLARLNADMIAGRMPDLLDLSGLNVGAYITKGILSDLYPYIDKDPGMKRGDFIPGILGMYEYQDKLYGISMGCRLETLVGKESILGDPSLWTMERMTDIIENLPSDAAILDNVGPMGLLRVFMQMGMNLFIDETEGKCFFDQDEFIQMLSLCKSMSSNPVVIEPEDMLRKDKLLLYRAYLTDITEFQEVRELFQGEALSWVGFPSSDGGKILATPHLPIGIIQQSAHGEEAWSFLRSMLTEDFQRQYVHFNFPLRQDVFSEKLSRLLEQEVTGEMDGGSPLIISSGEVEQLEELFFRIGRVFAYDVNIWKVIEEEAEYFFNGKKTARETADIIQNRIQIYLEANYMP